MERIISSTWRLRRLGRVEAGIFAWQFYEELADQAQQEAQAYESNLLVNMPDPLDTITNEQKHQEALDKAQEMKARQHTETATLEQAFIRDANEANAFSKLSRYETTIERGLYKALHELQRLQAARGAGGNVSPPVAVDIDVSGAPREDL